MATSAIRKYPIGIQSFEKLRRGQYIYVDKTNLVYQLATAGNPCFLSRPRRFGKSLLLSTFEAYFLGKKELFTGLAVEQLETEWAVHPVFHLDLNAERYDSVEELDNMLESQLSRWEQTYGITQPNRSISIRFMDVIREASVQTGRGVVVLIDEYDKPLLRSFHNEELQQQFRNRLTAFYTVLKSADPWLRFVFITGVTKFAQMSVFSELNQLTDISQLPQYATLCGMTRSEIEDSFAPDIEELGRLNNLTTEEVMNKLTRLYDGYRFSEYATEGIYNPFSLLSVMSYKVFKDYWFVSGTPTFLVNMLKDTDYDLRELDGIEVPSAALINYRASSKEPVPMIYQSGYLTIKSYDERFKTYTLGFPNEEVRYGFLNFVLPFYTPIDSEEGNFYIGKFIQELEKGDPEAFLTRLRAFFADIPYELNNKTERHYQVVFYLVFKLLGQFAEAEVRSAKGRADAVVKTADYIYVFEFKLDGTVDEAIRQIDDKGYLIPYTADGRKLVKVGVSFSREERNLGEWVIKG
ncbi:ATP-binding protein [Parabacteroides acidifaciens]|uniref:AAA family ATPase n=1 Tax=Parabacteroides acidifaciens TaxID=2290935 RepID=A0A3D8HJC8_9BACT|nr:ATP-binding protein [Parabacteroides acidifaciens]MBC8600354.1 ATP-binding protein [Parabacteroides acidifaciens]RDU50983.1 AAA family ATPase [Parabacteroides acidifaciens]